MFLGWPSTKIDKIIPIRWKTYRHEHWKLIFLLYQVSDLGPSWSSCFRCLHAPKMLYVNIWNPLCLWSVMYRESTNILLNLLARFQKEWMFLGWTSTKIIQIFKSAKCCQIILSVKKNMVIMRVCFPIIMLKVKSLNNYLSKTANLLLLFCSFTNRYSMTIFEIMVKSLSV